MIEKNNLHNTPSRKKATILEAIGGYFILFLSIIQGLALLPFYLNYIDINMYGYWVTIYSISALISVVNFGITPVLLQKLSVSYGEKKIQKFSNYFLNGIIIYFIISIIFLFISSIVYFFLDTIISVTDEQLILLEKCFIIYTISMFLTFFNEAFRVFFSSLLRPSFHIYITILSKIIGIFLVIFLLLNNYGLLSIPTYMLVNESLIFLVLLISIVYYYATKLNVEIYFSKIILKKLFLKSPIVLGTILGDRITTSSIPIIVTAFISADMTTLYMITNKISETILQGVRVIISSLSASLPHLMKEKDKNIFFQTTSKIFIIVLLISLICYSSYAVFNNYFISLWIDSNMLLDNTVSIFIAISTFFYTLVAFVRHIFFNLGNFKESSIIVFKASILFVIITPLLIHYIGILGVPLSLLISSIYMGYNFIKIFCLYGINIKNVDTLSLLWTILSIAFIDLALFYINLRLDTWFNFIAIIVSSVLVKILIVLLYNYNNLQQKRMY